MYTLVPAGLGDAVDDSPLTSPSQQKAIKGVAKPNKWVEREVITAIYEGRSEIIVKKETAIDPTNFA